MLMERDEILGEELPYEQLSHAFDALNAAIAEGKKEGMLECIRTAADIVHALKSPLREQYLGILKGKTEDAAARLKQKEGELEAARLQEQSRKADAA